MITGARYITRASIRSEYVASLEAGTSHKATIFNPWLDSVRSGWVVDMGTGPGCVAALLARRCAQRRVLAVDSETAMIDLASRRYRSVKNITFQVGDARDHIGVESVAWILSSVLHEVAADNGLLAVQGVLRNASSCLNKGGRLVLRDFVLPPDADRKILLDHHREDIRQGNSFLDFVAGTPHPIRFVGSYTCDGCVTYETDMAGAYEYLFRKDCGGAWHTELRQQYGFWSLEECESLVRTAGFRIVYSDIQPNHWVLQHRIRNRLRVRDAQTGTTLDVPAYQVLLYAMKGQ